MHPQQYPPQQFPQQMPPQGYYPQQPPPNGGFYPHPGYQPPQYGAPPQPQQPVLAKGTIADFNNQRSGGGGKGLGFPAIGTQYLMRVARDVNDGDVVQMTDYTTKVPLTNRDGSAKFQLAIPVIIAPGTSPQHPTGAATFYAKPGAWRDELYRAMAEAGCGIDPTTGKQALPKKGDVIWCVFASTRSSGMGSPAKIPQMVYTPFELVNQTYGPQAPPMEPVEPQVPGQYAQPPAMQWAQNGYPPPPGPAAPPGTAQQFMQPGAFYTTQPGTPGYVPPMQPIQQQAPMQQAYGQFPGQQPQQFVPQEMQPQQAPSVAPSAAPSAAPQVQAPVQYQQPVQQMQPQQAAQPPTQLQQAPVQQGVPQLDAEQLARLQAMTGQPQA